MASEKVTVQGTVIEQGELDAGFNAAREHADKSMYGKFISDEEIRSVVTEVIVAAADYRSGKII
jgi:hypothetical protein